MKRFNRLTCFILALLIMLSVIAIVPVSAGAAGTDNVDAYSEVTAMGSNSVGALIAAAINEEQQNAESEDDLENKIIGVTMESNNAAVEFSNSEVCTIVVAVFDEKGEVMLGSGISKDLEKNHGKTTVTINIPKAEMPRYFYLRAFILDRDNRPLGDYYESNYYTKAFQDFLAKTTDDFDPDLVCNFDDDKTDNFAVFDESTKNIAVDSYTVSGDTYTFTNIGSDISSLKKDDIIAFADENGEPVIIKVKSISVSGSTAVIKNSGDFELDDVFSYVKIDAEGDPDGTTADLSEADGVTLDTEYADTGLAPTGTQITSFSARTFPLSIEWSAGKVVVTGKAVFQIGCRLSIYYEKGTIDRDPLWEIDFFVASAMSGSVSIGGQLSKSFFGKGRYTVPTSIPGVSVGIESSLVVEGSVALEASFSVSSHFGYAYNSSMGFKSLCKMPTASGKVLVEGEFFFGYRIRPLVSALKTVELGFPIDIGLKINAKYDIVEGSAEEERKEHFCDWCIEGDIKVLAECSVELDLPFVKIKWDDFKLFSLVRKLTDFYYSSENGFGLGVCPNKGFTLDVYIYDKQLLSPIEDVDVCGVLTDSSGCAELRFPGGLVQLTVIKEGYKSIYYELDLYKSRTIHFVLQKAKKKPTPDLTDGDGLIITYNDSGKVIVAGKGELTEGYLQNEYMYYNEETGSERMIKTKDVVIAVDIGEKALRFLRGLEKVTILDGVETIGNSAFSWCENLKSVTIPGSVETIGDGAFAICESLTSITVPDSVTYIGDYAFSTCRSLTNAWLSHNIKSINDGLFYACNSLKSISIPAGVKSIGKEAFFSCADLKSIALPDGLETIGPDVFYYCESLTDVKIPDSVTSIGYYAFSDCVSLESITIPKKVKNIEEYTFHNCTNLKSVLLLDGITAIGDFAFYGCESLESITIPDSVKSIAHLAFYDCDSLSSVTIPKSVTSIEYHAFGYFENDEYEDEKVPNFIIRGYKGSEAEKYAVENGFEFIDLSKDTASTGADIGISPAAHDYDEDEYYDDYVESFLVEKSGLKPNADYVLLFLDGDADGELVNDMLLYIAQTKADKDGNVQFEVYGDFGDTYREAFILGACAHAKTHTETFLRPNESEQGSVVTVCDICGQIIESTELSAEPEPSILVGDVNSDGEVNNRDAMILDRYIADWAGYAGRIKNMDAADMDRKGTVDNRDAMILDRVAASWTGYYEKYCIMV